MTGKTMLGNTATTMRIRRCNLSEEKKVSVRFPAFSTLLATLFIGLKLTGHIDWKWIWVLSPLWIGFSIGVVLIILMIILATLADR